MSNFWANKLGVSKTPAPNHKPYVPSARPWWDDRPLPQPQAPQHPAQPQQQRPVQPQPSVPQRPGMSDTCPNPRCGSVNYITAIPEGVSSVMMGNARAHCFDCGYPYVQSGSGGLGHASKDANATPSRQIHDGSSQVVTEVIAHLK